MPLSNAERQKRWRERRNALAKAAEKGDAQRVADFLRNIAPVVKALKAEGRKNVSVAHLAECLEKQAVALRRGEELPDLPADLKGR